MSQQGWIKLHRKIRDNPIYEKGDYFRVWIELLLLANHSEETSFIWNNKKQILKRGQLLTGENKLSKKLRISRNTVHRILEYLKNEHQIEQQATNRFSIITIVNWDCYQINEQQNEQLVNSQRTASEQPVNTFKNDKKEETDKKEEKIQKWKIFKKSLENLNQEELKEKLKEILQDKTLEQEDMEQKSKIIKSLLIS